MSYSLIPTADYKAACDAIRAKTGKTELIKSGDMAAEISGIEGGGNAGEENPIVSITMKLKENGYEIRYKNGSGKSGSAAFDEAGNIKSFVAPLGELVSFENGYPTAVRDGEGNAVSIDWK